jgi:hypothetical protein
LSTARTTPSTFIEGAHSGHADGVARDRDWRLEPADTLKVLTASTRLVASAALVIEIFGLDRPASHTSDGNEARHQIGFFGK